MRCSILQPSESPLVLSIPSSKSLTHRAFLMAACSKERCVVKNPLWGDDTRSTLQALRNGGAQFQVGENDDLAFSPAPFMASAEPLDCGNSGTTLRLLLGHRARFEFETRFSGDSSLSKRPNQELLSVLEALGASTCSENGRLPISISGPIHGGTIHLPSHISSQFASSLLLSLPFLQEASTIYMAQPVSSRPYLDLTLDVAKLFGITIRVSENAHRLSFEIPGGQSCEASQVTVEGDWSTAAFPLVAGAIANREVHLLGLREQSLQGDRAIIDIMRSFGSPIQWQDDRLCIFPAPLQNPGHLDVAQTPDLFPAICSLASRVPGPTRIDGAPQLRHKECDRIQAMHEGFGQLGIRSEPLPDGLIVHHGPTRACSISSHRDHRIHMAFALLRVTTNHAIDISHPDCVAVSYPEFHDHLASFLAKDPHQ